MGQWPGETQNQRGWRPAFQGQRLLQHRLPQRRLQTGREKRFHSGGPGRRRKQTSQGRNPISSGKARAQGRQKMKSALHRCPGKLLHQFNGLTIQRFNDSTFRRLSVFCMVVFSLFARAQTSFPDPSLARSVSGQFIVTGAPSHPAGPRLAARPEITTNTDFVRLEPALLAVSAERIRESLARELNPELQGLNLPKLPPGKNRCWW